VTALLLDEMLSGAIAEQLRVRGLDVIGVVENQSVVGTSDEDLLVYAEREQRALVTANIGDFAVIATDWRATGRRHSGIVFVPYRGFPQDRSFVGALVDALAGLHDSGDLPGPSAEVFLHRS
jgi:Domain of unknown function (DUF5615)